MRRPSYCHQEDHVRSQVANVIVPPSPRNKENCSPSKFGSARLLEQCSQRVTALALRANQHVPSRGIGSGDPPNEEAPKTVVDRLLAIFGVLNAETTQPSCIGPNTMPAWSREIGIWGWRGELVQQALRRYCPRNLPWAPSL